MAKKKKRKRRSGIFGDSVTRTGLFIPVDPSEFKFCFALMGAGMHGNMPVKKPRPLMIEGLGEVTFKNAPTNRGMLAVTQHLRTAHPERYAAGETPPESMSMGPRIMELGTVIGSCFKKKDPRIAPLMKQNGTEANAIDIAEPLVEAATAKMASEGFDLDSLFSISAELLRKYDNNEDGDRACARKQTEPSARGRMPALNVSPRK